MLTSFVFFILQVNFLLIGNDFVDLYVDAYNSFLSILLKFYTYNSFDTKNEVHNPKY